MYRGLTWNSNTLGILIVLVMPVALWQFYISRGILWIEVVRAGGDGSARRRAGADGVTSEFLGGGNPGLFFLFAAGFRK